MTKSNRKTFKIEDGISFTEFFAFNKTICTNINDMRDSDCCSHILQKFKTDNPPDGWFKLHWENGNPKYEWYYKNGRQEGVSKSWWPNGDIKNIQHYKNGKRDGVLQGWYEDADPYVVHNKQTSGIRNYIDGKKDGEWIDYYKNGQIWMKKIFSKNKLISEEYWNKDNSVGDKSCHIKCQLKQFRKINPNYE
tara:strand:- start:3928 stop:4503 length:576 start_codon:yes stop_codon:yes gene_type:complete